MMSSMKQIYIFQTGSTFPEIIEKHGDFADMFSTHADDCIVIDVEQGEELPAFEKCAGVMVTGSHDMVTERLEWSEKLAKWLREAVQLRIPVLGVCYGHQLLAHALGGEVGFHKDGTEIGTATINMLPDKSIDPLFEMIPDNFPAHVVHAQTVLKLPDGAVILAQNGHDPHHAFRYGDCAWGVQFHPEFTAEIIKSYISRDVEKYTKMGLDVDKVLESVEETPVSCSIIRRFIDFVEGLD
ncbi:MAG: GMP synthase [Denitrovibrio sp.]|nr:MAG: GMP synthase [Denitrovibrio sp.]